MTLFYRRIIYSFFILAFVVIGPLILFYSAGYRYNTRINTIQQTGALVIKTHPMNGVRIYLDGELIESIDTKKRTVRITRLLPKEYNIRIAHDEYIDWTGTVMVRSAESTFLTDIELFKKNTFPILTEQFAGTKTLHLATSSEAMLMDYSFTVEQKERGSYIVRTNRFTYATTVQAILPVSEYVFYQGTDDIIPLRDMRIDSLYLFPQGEKSLANPYIVLPRVKHFDWLQDKKQLLYHNDFEIWVYHSNSRSVQLLTRRASGIDNVLWHPSGSYIIYISENSIHVLEVADRINRQDSILATLPEIEDMRIHENGEKLFVKTHIGSQQGWFEMIIQ